MADKVSKKAQEYSKKIAKERERKYLRFSTGDNYHWGYQNAPSNIVFMEVDLPVFQVRALRNYRRTLYPFNLNGAESSSKSSCKSLVEICSDGIVSHPSSTEGAIGEVPRELCCSLMKAALQNNRDEATQALICRWPWTLLSFRGLFPPAFTELKSLYCNEYVCGGITFWRDLTRSLVVNFLECITQPSDTKVKYLDISGYPTDEFLVKYLAIHTEVFQSVGSEVREHQYVIQLDALVEGNETCMQLCNALALGKAKESLLRLRIKRLQIDSTKSSKSAALLDLVDHKDLVALSIRPSYPYVVGLHRMSPNLRRLTSLTGLDLSWDDKTLDSDDADLLGQTLVELPALTRLNLSNTRLTNQLQTVISKMPASLVYLELQYCYLSENDLIFLSQSHHANTLRALNVGHNNLGNLFEHFLCLVGVMACRLIVLETQLCSFQKDHLTYFFNTLSKRLCHLRFWNISENSPAPTATFMEHIKAITEHSSLEILRVSLPKELAGPVSDQHRKEFVETLSKLFPDLVFMRRGQVVAIRLR